MLDRGIYVGPNFSVALCPVCGEMFAKCGLPNHLRRHQKAVAEKFRPGGASNRSPAWWDGWKERL